MENEKLNSSKLVVLVGNIGTGKTRYCKSTFNGDEVIIRPDEWDGTKDELQKRFFKEIEEALAAGKIVVVDGNNLTRKGRTIYLYFAKNAEVGCTAIDFGAGDEVSLQRRLSEPRGLTVEEWTKIHRRNQQEYEKPSKSEGFVHVIHLNSHSAEHSPFQL